MARVHTMEASCSVRVWKQPHQPRACLGKVEKAGELTWLPGLALGVEVLPGPSLLLPVSVSVAQSPGPSGLCLQYCAVEVSFSLTGDRGWVTSEAF